MAIPAIVQRHPGNVSRLAIIKEDDAGVSSAAPKSPTVRPRSGSTRSNLAMALGIALAASASPLTPK